MITIRRTEFVQDGSPCWGCKQVVPVAGFSIPELHSAAFLCAGCAARYDDWRGIVKQLQRGCERTA